MKDVRACGVLVMRREPEWSFLLMRHADRWDLPKGHLDPGESDRECALRELHEETGIGANDIDFEEDFEFVTQYTLQEKRTGDQWVRKTVKIYLAWLHGDVAIRASEHLGFQWFKWEPPHSIQTLTIDPLLAAVENYFESRKS
jgi:bis(5'-nucleosidyl)-tetraphosphatase